MSWPRRWMNKHNPPFDIQVTLVPIGCENEKHATDGDGVCAENYELVLKPEQNPPVIWPEGALVEELVGQWWVAHTKARNEKALAWDLLKRGTSYFLAMTERVRTIRGRKVKSLAVLFPGYVFFCGTDDERYAAMTTSRIASTIDVVDQGRFVRELSGIQKALASPKQLDPYPYLKAGRKCVVTFGPLKGVEGLLVSRKNVSRLVLEVHVLGQAVATEIDANLLEVID